MKLALTFQHIFQTTNPTSVNQDIRLDRRTILVSTEANSMLLEWHSMMIVTDMYKQLTNDLVSSRYELSELKDETHRLSEAIRRRRAKPSRSYEKRRFGQSLSDSINDVGEKVIHWISSEIEKPVLVDPVGARFDLHITRVQSRTLNIAYEF